MKYRLAVSIVLGVAATTFAPSSFASCGGANCFLVTGTQEGVAEAGKIAVDLSYRFIPMDTPHSGSHKTDVSINPAISFDTGTIVPGAHQELRTDNELVQLDVAMGVSERTSVAVSLPIVNNRRHEHLDLDAGGVFSAQTYSGFGDIRIMLRHAHLRQLRHQFVGGIGVKTPSGVYKLRDAEGEISEPGVQPGTGSWDPIVTAYYAYQIRPHALDWFVSGSWQYATENRLDYRFGDTRILNTGFNDRVSVGGRDVVLSVQLNARNAPRDELLGVDVSTTGGTFIYLTPGVRIETGEATGFYAHLQIPVYQRANETNLVPSYAFILGFSHQL
jgi:hypothetical protein